MKLDWRKTFLIGLGFLGISVMWQIYNAFVPIFLQGGNTEYDRQAGAVTHEVVEGDTWASIAAQYEDVTAETLMALNAAASDEDLTIGAKVTITPYVGFGLNATVTGFIMTLDNIAALFILPVIGVWSDRTRTRIGRRYPYILAGAPLAAAAFVLIPAATGMIDPAASGSVPDNGGAFALFMVAAGLMLLAMAIFRTPVISLMPDLIPSPLRSKANGVINLMGGVGGIIATLGLARLFDTDPVIPFLVSSVVLVAAVILLFFTVKEPDVSSLPHEESDEEAARQGLKGVKLVPPAYRRSLVFLLLAIFGWFVGYNAVETFFTSYATTTLKVSAGAAPMLFSAALIAFIVFAVPAGYIGTRFGRKRTISAGLVIFAVLLVIAFFVQNVTVVVVILALGGAAWALVNINSLPMVVDTTDDERLLGTYTGLYYFASQSAAIFGPVLNGVIIDLAGRNYSMIFLVAPAFFVLAIVCMFFVTRGEAHPVETPAA
ncbi:MAG: MFS transporter [Anaerolineae bacterium]|nr:MFS transporter [Anaerolineae bacterium]